MNLAIRTGHGRPREEIPRRVITEDEWMTGSWRTATGDTAHAGDNVGPSDAFSDPAADADTQKLVAIRNDYQWTPATRRAFLEELASTGSIHSASRHVGKSRRSAYNLRFREDGAAFRIGWDAAVLVAQAAVHDALMDRVLHGQEEEVYATPHGGARRRRYDNRLGYRLLERLDRVVATQEARGSHAERVQMAVQDFAAFLDLIDPQNADADQLAPSNVPE
jgi:hypothetical protein